MSELNAQDQIDAIWQLFKETDERLDQRIKETDARLDQRIKETDARLDQRYQESDKQLRRLEGMFGIQWGRMMEALVEPAALQLFQERGIDVHSSHQRQKSRINGRNMELDIVLENHQDSVVIEVKSRMQVEDVDDFLLDLSQVHDFFSRFDGRRV